MTIVNYDTPSFFMSVVYNLSPSKRKSIAIQV